jgi:hypothetical protein
MARALKRSFFSLERVMTWSNAEYAEGVRSVTGGLSMSIPQSQLAPWIRKHDKPGSPLVVQAPIIFFPRSLEDAIELCSARPPGQRLHAAGSHWALSTAAVSDHAFVETHDFNQVFPAMGRTLFNVVPACLSDQFLDRLNNETLAGQVPEYFVHFEAGKRIFQLYAELDVGDAQNPESLCVLMQSRFGNNAFTGSWGFQTLGGAGGQTVVGALSTGTHGADFDRPPIADAMVALHIVLDGGRHVWIERPHRDQIPFTDEQKLRALFGQAKFGGPHNFDVLYSEDAWRAAIVQVGRFGIVYSAVLKVVPQYGLREKLVLSDWESVRDKVADPNSDLFQPTGQEMPHRSLQIAINPIPSTNGTTHRCGITKRWTMPLDLVTPSSMPPVSWGGMGNPAGRPERVGNILVPNFDPILHAPRFSMAGTGVPWSPDDSGITSFSLLDSACADADFMDGVVSGIWTEIDNFLSNNAVAIGGGLAGAIAAGLGPGIAALAPWLLAILAILAAFLDWLRSQGGTMGQALNNLRNDLLGSSDPSQRAAGVLVWRAIAAKVFESQQSPHDYNAISYAIMDGHNYEDISCTVNVRSVEVFFDATDPNLIAFVDRLLQFESDQEFQSGKSVVGYISLRFCQPSAGLIAPEVFPRTVAVECSGLADEAGSTEFVDFAVALAQDPNIKGVLHWGQQNDSTQTQIEFRFGDTPGSPTGRLHDWRAVLGQLTDNGRLDGFSSHFTRHAGLEVVQPLIGAFSVQSPPSAGDPNCTLAWDCRNNPNGSTAGLEIISPSSGVVSIAALPLQGTHVFTANQTGTWIAVLRVNLTVNGQTRHASQALQIAGA